MHSLPRHFTAAFFTSIILIAALCLFLVVDLSTDRYMPGKAGPFLAVTRVGEDGLDFSFMGEEYIIASQPVADALGWLDNVRTALPASTRASAVAAGELHEWLEQMADQILSDDDLPA